MIVYPDGGQECLQCNRAKKAGDTTASRRSSRAHKAKVGKERQLYHKKVRTWPGKIPYDDYKHMQSITQEITMEQLTTSSQVVGHGTKL
ncbi:hypothetical protein LCGC14_0376970 [marine sediment metagenome]|uniref:Uncharacterized protein n=1 Tax=marine sediment metagenome TaxID=412755 RepID=A0A0F9VQT7_9ZZZZ